MAGSQSVSDLTTIVKTTHGQVPPALVGCSVTVLGDRVFVFGGRTVTTKQMTNNLYILDLHSLEWYRHIGSPDSARPPCPRYFHSATVYRHYIVYFGGMKADSKRTSVAMDDAVTNSSLTLNDVYLFDSVDLSWIKQKIPPSLFTPKPRYAHIATITSHMKDKLVVMGGQDEHSEYVNEFNVLDLVSFEWLHGGHLDRPCGIYRTVPFDPPMEIKRNQSKDHQQTPWNSDQDNHDLFIYANYSFTSTIITRELYSFDPSKPTTDRESHDYSHFVTSNKHVKRRNATSPPLLPSGLRFPHGQVIGQHLIVAGTHLGTYSKSYQVWALHLDTMIWSRIDTGSQLITGAWNCGNHYNNHWIVFGDRHRDIFKDYGQRQINFADITMVHLEAFGIYMAPTSTCDNLGRDLGLTMLNEPNMADIYVTTSDYQSIPANAHILSLRWPYVAKLFYGKNIVNSKTKKQYYDHFPNGDSCIRNSQDRNDDDSDANVDSDDLSDTSMIPAGRQRHDRGIGKTLLFPESYSVALAFLQYVYTDHLLTVQQYQPSILARLLILSDMYHMPRLKQLSTHALHQILTISTASLIYEASTLTGQSGLQIRALRVMLNAKKMIEQQQHILTTSPILSPLSSFSIPPPASPPSSLPPTTPPSSLPPTTPPPPTPTSPGQRSLTSQTFLYDYHHEYFFSLPMPSSPKSTSTATQSRLQHHQQFPINSTAHSGKNNTNTAYLIRKKSSPNSFSSSSSSASSHDDQLLFPKASSAITDNPSSLSSSKEANNATSQGKFTWRKLQQSTIALAKPKPLRINASNAQPFYDL